MTPVLRFEGITKEYSRRAGWFKRERFRAVEGVDLAIDPGQLVVIAGRSGAGKSTIARLMVGLTRPTAGRIIFDGVDLSDRRRWRELAGRRQIVFQNPYRSLSPRLTAAETVVEPARIIGRAASAPVLLKAVGLSAGLADAYPARLSAGQRQRLAIARALSTGPDLLVLDEPTSALDPIAAAGINEAVATLRSKMAVVLISHDPRARRAADRVIVVEDGRIAT